MGLEDWIKSGVKLLLKSFSSNDCMYRIEGDADKPNCFHPDAAKLVTTQNVTNSPQYYRQFCPHLKDSNMVLATLRDDKNHILCKYFPNKECLNKK